MTSSSGKISRKYVSSILDKLKANQNRESTKANYLGIWRHFNRFLILLDDRVHGCWEEKTALFGAYLTDAGIQSSTLKSNISAIKSILRQDGYIWDDNKILLCSLILGCKLQNDTIKTRLPIQRKLLELLLFEVIRCYKNNPQPYLEKMYIALFSLGYYGLMRIGELTSGTHPVKACNVHVGINKNKILLVLYSSKTHGKESNPQKIKITASRSRSVQSTSSSHHSTFFCPFKAVREYLVMRGPYIEDNEPFFVFKDRSAVTPSHVRTMLTKLLKTLGLQEELYSFHSLCGGRSTDLILAGFSITQVRIAGRWRSNAVYRYLKP